MRPFNKGAHQTVYLPNTQSIAHHYSLDWLLSHTAACNNLAWIDMSLIDTTIGISRKTCSSLESCQHLTTFDNQMLIQLQTGHSSHGLHPVSEVHTGHPHTLQAGVGGQNYFQ